jgi:PhnB protein
VEPIIPVLTVEDVDQAVAFYERAFEARELSRFGPVVDLAIGIARFRIAGENADAQNVSPTTVGATTVRLNLLVEDPDAFAARAVATGAREVFPIADQPYGLRQGRIADPFGHHWLIGRPL